MKGRASPAKATSLRASTISPSRKNTTDEHKSERKEPSLYELSYLDGLKKNDVDDREEDEDVDGENYRSKSQKKPPLDYQLEEIDSGKMML